MSELQEHIVNVTLKKEGISITSLDLIKLINHFRAEEGNTTEKQHKHLMRDIRLEIETLESVGINQSNFGLVEYIDSKGEKRPCYEMNKAGVLQMLNKESAVVRYKTVCYIEKLEKQNKASYLIEDPIERAKAWIKEQEEKKAIEEKNRMLMHSTKLYTTTEIAKELNMKSAKALNALLYKMHIQFKQNDTWVLYSDYADKGYTSIKQIILDSGRIAYDRRWTQSGRDFILNQVSEYQEV